MRERQYAVVVLNPWQQDEWANRLRAAALASGHRLTRLDMRVEEYLAD